MSRTACISWRACLGLAGSSLLAACLEVIPGAHSEAGSARDQDASWLDASASGMQSADAASPDSAAVVAAAIPPERTALCARPADDAVRDIFCKSATPSVRSLRELAARLSLDALPAEADEAADAQATVDTSKLLLTAVLLGHSTALSGQLVSPINPRAILLNRATLLAFQRGVQKVEIASADRALERFNFYLLTFRQACSQRSGGCLPGDLYTPRIERDWESNTLQDDEDLKNSVLDCRQCHQRGLEKPILLMRELLGPWPHFFSVDHDGAPYMEGMGPSGRELVLDYQRAHDSEAYAGISRAALRQTAGLTLQSAVISAQPLQFSSFIPEQLERQTSAGLARRSAIWDEAYAAFKRGEQLPLPYFEQRATDAAKQAALTEAYARYRRGELPAEALPDLADIYPDDPQVRAEIGLATEPDASGADTLIQACGACHNDVLDQRLSRARFNVAVARMSRSELELAITRIELPADDERVMPPRGTRQLHPDGKHRLLELLRQEQRRPDDDAKLEAAAKAGMTTRGYVDLAL